MKAKAISFLRTVSLAAALAPGIALANADAVNNCANGVLIPSTCVNQGTTFGAYITELLKQNWPLFLFAAFLMVVFSGVQYMLSGATPEAQKAAKQRILGILGGLVFYLFMNLILHQLSSNLK